MIKYVRCVRVHAFVLPRDLTQNPNGTDNTEHSRILRVILDPKLIFECIFSCNVETFGNGKYFGGNNESKEWSIGFLYRFGLHKTPWLLRK